MTAIGVLERDGLDNPRRRLAALAIGMGIAMAVLDAAIVNVALPSIAGANRSGASATVWVVNADQLAIVAVLLPFAAAGGRFGFRSIYVGGLVLFAFGSVGCALSPSLAPLIAARALQGLGAGAIMSANGALIRFTYPKAMIGWGVGVNALVVSVSAAGGPTLAAIILTIADWRWLFLVNLPIVLANIALAGRNLPNDNTGERSTDWVSNMLAVFCFATIFAAVGLLAEADRKLIGLCLAGAGFAGGIVLIRRERRAERPVVPVDLLRKPLFGLAFLASTTAFAAYMAAFVTLPFYLNANGAGEPARIGLLITPWPVALGVAAAVAGRLSDRLKPARLSALGMMVMAGGLVCVAFARHSIAGLDIAWRLALCGAGFGLFQAPNNRVLLSSAPKSRAGAAGGAMAMARMIGMTVGAALAAVFLQTSALLPWAFPTAAALGLGAAALCLVRGSPDLERS